MDGLVLFCSCYSSLRSRERASRIPPKTCANGSWGLKLAHVGSLFALFSRLGRFLNVLARLGRFCAFGNDFFQFLNDFSSILWRFGTDFWWIWGVFGKYGDLMKMKEIHWKTNAFSLFSKIRTFKFQQKIDETTMQIQIGKAQAKSSVASSVWHGSGQH